MRVLLVNPSSFRDRRAGPYSALMPPVAPLGIALLAAAARAAGHEARIEDQYASDADSEAVAALAERLQADVVGLGCLSPNMPAVEAIVAAVRRRRPATHLVLGGIHATYFAEDLLRNLPIDSIVLGEGEATFVELLERMERGEELVGTPGLATRRENRPVRGSPRPFIEPLASLPFPAWDLVRLGDYWSPPRFMMRARFLPVQTARGCPYNCSYCSQNSFYRTVRARPMPAAVDEVERLVAEFGISAFAMIDAIFPLSERLGLEFCEELTRRGLAPKVRWFTETRCDLVTPRLLREFKRCGCTMVMYGLESANERHLAAAGKRLEPAKAVEAVRWTKEAGIGTYGLFMVGFPNETRAEARNTVRFAHALDCDVVSFGRVTPYPGSRLYEEHKGAFGADVPPWQWNNLVRPSDDEACWRLPGMSHEELTEVIRAAMLGYYLRPRIVWRHLRRRSFSWREMAAGFVSLVRDLSGLIRAALGRQFR